MNNVLPMTTPACKPQQKFADFGAPRLLPASAAVRQPRICTKPLDLLEFNFCKVSKGSAKSVKVKPFFFIVATVPKMDTFPDSGTGVSPVPEGVPPSNLGRTPGSRTGVPPVPEGVSPSNLGRTPAAPPLATRPEVTLGARHLPVDARFPA